MAEYDKGAAFINNLSVYAKLFIELVKSGPLLLKCMSFMDIKECLEIANLQKNMTDTAATQLLLDRMLNKHLQEPGVWKQFLVALEEAGYSHVANVLRGETQHDEETQKLQKKIINIFASEIECRLTPGDLSSIVVNLKSRDVIQPCDKQEIESLLNRIGIWAATLQLLYVLPCKKDSWYSEFLLTLLHLEDTCNTKTFSKLVNSIDPDWYKKNLSLSSDNVSVPSMEAATSKKQTEFDTDIEQTKVLQVCESFQEQDLMAPNLDSDSDESVYEDAISDSIDSSKPIIHSSTERTTSKSLVNDLNFCSETQEKETSMKKQMNGVLQSNIHDVQSEISEIDNTKIVGVGVQPQTKKKTLNIQSVTTDKNITDPKTFDDLSTLPDTERKEEIDSDYDDAELAKREEKLIELREYQKELVEHGLKGQNVMICAPTGSGKTRAAFRIVQNHLTGKSNKIRKVVFLVGQVPLADQQHKECQTLLPTYKSEVLTGDTQATAKEPFGETVKRNDILVMTAQLLVDALLYKDIDNLGVFSLIIFDECHHTHDRHPFNQIMDHYMDMKFSRDCPARLPQIVGLTASLGVGKAKRCTEAMGHILKLMSNLDAEEISTVCEHQAELASHVNSPKEDIKAVPPRKLDPFKEIVCRIMRNIEEHMAIYKDLDKIAESNSDFKSHLSPPSLKGSDVYIQWISTFRQQCALIRDSEVKQYYTTCRQHLQIYNDALIINDDCRSADAVEHLESEFTNLYRVKDETDKWLMQLFEDKIQDLSSIDDDNPLCRNPKLEALEKMIKKAYEENHDLRGIVFVKTRDLAEYMARWMIETDGLRDLNPTKFVGAVVHTTKGGMTQRKQKDVIDYFKGGTHKLIIATSIAQEGLDIRKCNLVVRYDHVTNEIALVQSRGRARADDSVYKVIGQQGTVQKEELNLVREQLMFEGMRELKQYISENRDEFLKDKKNRQEEAKIERELLAHKRRSRVYRDGEFELLCIKCNEFCCLSTSLRVIKNAHHIVIDEHFKERVKLKPSSAFRIDDFESRCTILCSKCGQNWGVVFDHLGIQLPAIAIKHFLITDYSNNQTLCKKWSGVPFRVKEFGLDDKQKLRDAFNNTD